MKTRAVYVAGGARIPFAKSMTTYRYVTLQELMTASLQHLVDAMHLQGRLIGDVGLGAVINSSMNWNLARECVLGTTLDPHTPAYTLQRACGTSLETTLQIALKIANYQIDDGIAGGVDSNSDLPVMFPSAFSQKMLSLNEAKTWSTKLKTLLSLRPRDFKAQYPAVNEPRTGLSMGQHTEKMVKEWQISRAAQDELAMLSHQHAAQAYDRGFYDDLVFPFHDLKRDKILRPNTTMDKLAQLKPAFDFSGAGSLTAGNSTPLTDGSSAVYLVSEELAKHYGYPLMARFVDAQVAAVDFVAGQGLLMAPTIAVNALLKRNHLSLQDFTFYEIHEAFAGQVLCTLAAWESAEYCRKILQRDTPLGSIDRSKMNVNGGSLALGHPFAATGTRIVAGLAKLLQQHPKSRGLISICTAGGMGVAAIMESD